MADEPATPTEPQDKPAEDDHRVPYDRFKTANDRARELDRELKEARAKLEEMSERDLSEQQKLAKRAEEAEKRAADLEQRTVRLERGSWVKSAAAKLDFNDPDDAVAFANLGDLADERDAERAVKDLAKAKPHLVKPKDDKPQVGRVLANGQPVDGDAPPIARSPEEQVKMAEGKAVLNEILKAKGQQPV